MKPLVIASTWDRFWFEPLSSSAPVQWQRRATCALAIVWLLGIVIEGDGWWGDAGWQAAQFNRSLSVSTEGIWPARFRLTPLWLTSSFPMIQLWCASGIAACAWAMAQRHTQIALGIASIMVLCVAQRLTWSTGALAPYLIALLGYQAVVDWNRPIDWTRGFSSRLICVHTWLLLVAALAWQLSHTTWWQGEAVWWLASHQRSKLLTIDLLGGRLILINVLTHAITLSTAAATFGLWPFSLATARWRRHLGLTGLLGLCIAYALFSNQWLYAAALLCGGLSFWPSAAEDSDR